MNALYKELSAIAKQKSILLKTEAHLWEKLAQILETTPIEKEKLVTSVSELVVTLDRPVYGVIRLAEVARYTGLSRSSIYKLMSEERFPQSVVLGARAVGWLEQDIAQWVKTRAISRGTRDAER